MNIELIINQEDAIAFGREFGGLQLDDCSGSIKPDTNVGGNIATISEVSDDQETTYFFA